MSRNYSNEDMEAIDKYDYLAGLLQGTAAKAIAGLEGTASNYKEAKHWSKDLENGQLLFKIIFKN